MKAREAYFKLKYFVEENSKVTLFYFYKKNDKHRMGSISDLLLSEELQENNISLMEYTELYYGENWMFWALSPEGQEFQKELNAKAGLNANPLSFLSDKEFVIMSSTIENLQKT